jgi:hypothetical protein
MNPLQEAFNKHLDTCEQCHGHPFNLCSVGRILLESAVFLIQAENMKAIEPRTIEVSSDSDEAV